MYNVFWIYLVFYSQGHIATGSLQVEETSAYSTVNHWSLEHEAPGSRLELAASEVGGENSTNTTNTL